MQYAEGKKPIIFLLTCLIGGLYVGVSSWFVFPPNNLIWRLGGVMLGIVVTAYGVAGYIYAYKG